MGIGRSTGLIHFLMSNAIGAVAVLALPWIVKGIHVKDMRSSAKLVIAMFLIRGVLDLVLGFLLGITFFLTLGLAYIVFNAIVLDFGADLVEGVSVDSFKDALVGSVVLSILWTILNFVLIGG